MKAMLVLNGEACELPALDENLNDYAGVFCSDGGFRHLATQASAITAVIGDRDSAIGLPDFVPFLSRPDQNHTDFDKSLMVLIEQGYQAVDVYCVGGGEQDHFLGNLNTAYRFREHLDIVMFDRFQRISLCADEHTLCGEVDDIVSVYPYPTAVVSSTGLCYEMETLTLDTHELISIRNALSTKTAHLRVHDGVVFIFQARTDLRRE